MKNNGVGARLSSFFLLSLLTVPKVLPYRWRVPLVGWVTARVIAPLVGYEKRALKNLALVCPDLAPDEARRIARAASDNSGRVMAEMFSRKAFLKRVHNLKPRGPGLALLEQARLDKRPIIAVTGHIGNYDAGRAHIAKHGHEIGVLYKPMTNPYFNAHYVRRIEAISKPSFQLGRRGLTAMIRHLRAGKMVALLTDQRDRHGALLSFFGQPVLTPLSAAEMALKYNALLIPMYSIRRENGLDFDAIVEMPIPHSDPETMMQQVNDSLEAQVRAHMEQWLWVHRRWQVPKAQASQP